MRNLLFGLALLSSFANAGTYFECDFQYSNNGLVETDVLSSDGQQSSKIDGFLSSVSNGHFVWNEAESRSETRYYVNLYKVDVSGLEHLKSFAITENDLSNAVSIGSNIKSEKVIVSKTSSVAISCIRHEVTGVPAYK